MDHTKRKGSAEKAKIKIKVLQTDEASRLDLSLFFCLFVCLTGLSFSNTGHWVGT